MKRPLTALLRIGVPLIAILTSSAVLAQNATTIAANPGTTGNGPMGSSNYHVSEHIYLASEIGSDMTITDVRFAMNVNTGLPKTYNNVNIYLTTTAGTTFVAGTYNTAGYTLVYSGPMTYPALGFTGVTLTTPFAYTMASGNLQMMVTRLDGVAAAGPVMNAANGNSSSGTLNTCRRYNNTTAPVIGSTALALTPFRAAVQFVDAGGTCTAFPKDFAQINTLCWQPSHALWVARNAANGYAAAGTGSNQWLFFTATAGTTLNLMTPVFTPFGVTKQLNFDVAGATFPANPVDQIIVEGSTNGGGTWTETIATLDNGVGGALNPTDLSTTASYIPTTAGEWATLAFSFPGTVNRIRFRAVSQFGNNVYIDNVTVTDPPACPTPTDVAISDISGFNADVSWACAGCTGQYFIEYGPAGFIPGTTDLAGGGTMAGPFAGPPQTLTLPTARTDFDVYVRQDCGSGVYSTNSTVAGFLSGCGAAPACAYDFHLTDNFGDGWNGALVDVQEENLIVGTLTMELPLFGCERTMSIELCHDSALTLICTAAGAFPDEPGATVSDPFGGVVFEFRGPTFYPGNCAIAYPNPGVTTVLSPGSLHADVVDCVQDPCIDPPTAGTLQSDVSALCSVGGTVNLIYSGGTGGVGQTIVWQSSPDGVAWSTIPSATGSTYADNPTDTTYYQVIITCGANDDTSNVVVVNVNSFLCYCIAAHPPGCGNGNIVNVTLGTLNNTSVCDPPAYTAYSPSATTTTTVEQGVGYSLSVTTDQSCIISIWADWDHNGLYDTYEWTQVTLSSTASVAATVNLAVPLSAAVGPTNIRIRSRFSGNPNGPGNACTSFGSGETEDYIIQVDPAPPCLPATSVVFSSVSTTGFTVNWTNGVNSCGLATYTVEYGPAGFIQGTGTTTAPVTAGPVTITGLTALTPYDVYVTRDCTPCGNGPGVSAFGQVVTYPDCAAAAPIACPSGIGVFGPNGPGAWNFVEPLFGFTTVGTEQLFFLQANVLGSYTMSLTAAVGSSIVAIYIKPVGSCDPTGWTYVGTNQFTVQTFNFPIAATGDYWVLVDPVSSSLPINTYGVTFVCPVQNIDCSTAEPVTCGSIVQSSTSGLANTLPLSACPFPVSPSTGGSVWYSFSTPTDQEVTFSTCGSAQFDTRISVFTGPDCTTLTCLALNDDGSGCPDFSSEVSVAAAAGVTYYVAVHGFGAEEGIFQMSVLCAPPCVPTVANDVCSSAQTLIPALNDGSGIPTPGDNSCAHGDLNTSCDVFGTMHGMWYAFNSGPGSTMFMDLLTNNQNGALTANGMNYALFDGTCSGLGATGELICSPGGDGAGIALPPLTPSTDYLLYLWNNGGVSFEGSFSVLLLRPGLNDAGIDSILEPNGSLCSSELLPRVVLRNHGQDSLFTVDIVYDVDGLGTLTYAWTGALASNETDTLYLPPISTSQGVHTLNVATANPNGSADEIPANDGASKLMNITGESVIVDITTDNNGGQITWTIVDAFGFTISVGGPFPGQNNQSVETTACLPTNFGDCYGIVLNDAGGDGLCCLAGTGAWQLRTLTGRVLIGDLFSNTPSGSVSPNSPPAISAYGSIHEFCLPPGPSDIMPDECNVFTNFIVNKVYCASVPGVLLYQFEFSDPDAGFLRRIAVPRNWVKFSEMVTSPLTPGVVYFTRVRVDQGASGFADDHFGAGCEMAVNAATLGCTSLIDNSALPTHSCGVTKSFGGSDKIWTQPIVGASAYRFRFVNIGEGYDRTIQRPSYVCLLSWVTNPLVNGSTYSVTVNTFVNGVWTGFCGSACNVTILNPPAQDVQMTEGSQGSLVLTDHDLVVFPNPTTDGRVNLHMSGLDGGSRAISIEVHDLFGRRIMAEQRTVEGDAFNLMIQLDATSARGPYLVTVTVDGQVLTRRVNLL